MFGCLVPKTHTLDLWRWESESTTIGYLDPLGFQLWPRHRFLHRKVSRTKSIGDSGHGVGLAVVRGLALCDSGLLCCRGSYLANNVCQVYLEEFLSNPAVLY